MSVWSGHSCPLPLTLTLMWIFELYSKNSVIPTET